ncbi:hypothetical protein ACLG6S_17575 [Thermodesulfobacteriota bacterium B35]
MELKQHRQGTGKRAASPSVTNNTTKQFTAISNYSKNSNTFGKSSAVRQLCVIAAGRYSPPLCGKPRARADGVLLNFYNTTGAIDAGTDQKTR